MPDLYDALEKIFHEPNRLAITSELSAAREGLSFGELKTRCGLTDGNLSRHLTMLEREGIIEIAKSFVGSKPRTTVFMTASGRAKFVEYLNALEQVLRKAAASASAKDERPREFLGEEFRLAAKAPKPAR